ncbi:hypothetical protein GCM10020229_32640 [Kitasatospora albolonga]|uniref:hypothetical protein n=1 Tax=Kitasatospora albolonga TaxID=68173 RepID=UPI0031F0E6DC
MLESVRVVVQPLLEPGEKLIEAARVTLVPGIPRPPEQYLTPARPSAVEERLAKPFGLLRRAYTAVNPLSSAVGAVEDRMVGAVPDSVFHGTGMGGGWESAAGRFVIRLHTEGGHTSGLFAVTDRRVAVAVDRSALWQLFSEEYALHWAVPRHEVRELRRNATGVLQRGRIDLLFADGSWAGVTADLPRNADPLVAAFHG